MLKLKYHQDPGHGWIAAKIELVRKLGIASQITAYSYKRGQAVYLEEDCDAMLLLNALKERGIRYELDYRNSDRRSPIRSYERFTTASNKF